jgi:phosphoribosylaminoimidazolecarboxamide formyltransferase/IMP cyclohydrolase
MDNPLKEARRQYSSRVKEEFPDELFLGGTRFVKKIPMRYGENPGTPAAFYEEDGASGTTMAGFEVLQEGSKGLSYINVADMDLGQRLARKLTLLAPGRKACVIIKHEMPSAAALGEGAVETFEKAWNSDPLSNFGSVDVFNHDVTAGLAEKLVESPRNVEVVYAPGYEKEAPAVLAQRKALRVVRMPAPPGEDPSDNGLEFKRLAGGLLLQRRQETRIMSPETVDVVSRRKPRPEEVAAALLAWNVSCLTRSNAVVIASPDKVHGIGSGQRSRIDAADCAVRFSRRGYGPEGCFMASDAFMPFPDVVELAAQNGITGIIYPLGSVRDQEVIDRADELGLAMIVTRRPGETDCERCFLHR